MTQMDTERLVRSTGRRVFPTVVLTVVATVTIAVTLLLSTLGTFMVGFGELTGCTTTFGCSETGCAPCRSTWHWVLAGGIVQVALALGLGAALFLLRRRWSRFLRIVLCLVVVVLAIAVSVLAQREGDRAYESSSAGVGALRVG